MLAACSATVSDGDAPSVIQNAPISPDPNEGQEPQGPSCTPEVPGLVPTTQKAVSIACPKGWAERDDGTPISGRFKSRGELVDALCVPIDDDADPRAMNEDLGVDFTRFDVFATPYDPTARALPVVNERTPSELWVRVTGSCSSSAKAIFATALFVVPKDAKVDEQRCSVVCAQ